MFFHSPDETSELSLQSGLLAAINSLQSFVERPDLGDVLRQAFGMNADVTAAEKLLRSLAAGELPRVELVESAVLNGAYGAFVAASNTILISDQLVHDSSSGNAVLTAVLLEEIGHYIDARVNSRDAPGDEGEIFARFVQGLQLDPATLQSLRSQNDHATIRSTEGGGGRAGDCARRLAFRLDTGQPAR